MTSLSNILLDKEILLESGTNELEVLVFNVADYTFGINVAKVREVLPAREITTLPKAHPSVRGVFKLRDQVIPCVSLLDHLGIEGRDEQGESTLILTDLNKQQTAFLVDDVERIHRLSWEDILAVPALSDLAHTPATALARCAERLIVMLDFEMILDEVTEQLFRTDEVANPLGLPREKLHVLLAEDSPTVREAIGKTLRSSGYQNLTFFENGAEAWAWISRRFEETQRVEDIGDLLICDVEMPQVDGFHLTKQLKEHGELRQIPVLLYSSIITPDNRKKGAAVGADAQVAKPELTEVVRLADELIEAAQRESRSTAIKEVAAAAEAQQDVQSEETSQEISARAEIAPMETTSSAAGPLVDQCEPEPPTVPAAELFSSLTSPDDVPAESPPPRNVDASLWRTFHRELTERTEALSDLLLRVSASGRRDETVRPLARVLHTIKSAAMVIPLDEVTACTHVAESILEQWRVGRGSPPEEALAPYLAWLGAVVGAGGEIDVVLAQSAALQTRLSAALEA